MARWSDKKGSSWIDKWQDQIYVCFDLNYNPENKFARASEALMR
jgi:hypothetical protein